MRTMVKHEETRNTLIQKSWRIFLEKGYEKCTMSMILGELSISKGEFYHYFKSKEECARACANYYALQCSKEISQSMNDGDTPIKKLKTLINMGAQVSNNNDVQRINSATNQLFHQMVMTEIVKNIAPLYANVFEEGNEMNEWQIPFPLEMAQIFLTITNFYLDDNLFNWSEEEMESKINACKYFLESLIGGKLCW